MKNKFWYFLLWATITMFAVPACRTGSGCPSNADMAPKLNKKGGVKKSKRSKAGLFPSKVKKKVGVRS